MDLVDVKQLFNYTEWANELAMAAAGSVPHEGLRRDFGISHKSIFGTVVGMIRQLGIDPPATDLIFYVRREISPK